jgi:hypothetical protein
MAWMLWCGSVCNYRDVEKLIYHLLLKEYVFVTLGRIFFARGQNSFPVGCKGQKHLLEKKLETNSQFALSLTRLILKWQVTLAWAKIRTYILLAVYFCLQRFLVHYIASMMVWQVNDDEKTRTDIHALSGIRIYGFSIQATKAYSSERAATGTFTNYCRVTYYFKSTLTMACIWHNLNFTVELHFYVKQQTSTFFRSSGVKKIN